MPLESHFLLRHDSFCHVIALLRSRLGFFLRKCIIPAKLGGQTLFEVVFDFFKAWIKIGNDTSLGSVCFDFRTTNIVRLSLRSPNDLRQQPVTEPALLRSLLGFFLRKWIIPAKPRWSNSLKSYLTFLRHDSLFP